MSIVVPTDPSAVVFFDQATTGRNVGLLLERQAVGCQILCSIPEVVLTAPQARVASFQLTETTATVGVAYPAISWRFSDGGVNEQTASWNLTTNSP